MNPTFQGRIFYLMMYEDEKRQGERFSEKDLGF